MRDSDPPAPTMCCKKAADRSSINLSQGSAIDWDLTRVIKALQASKAVSEENPGIPSGVTKVISNEDRDRQRRQRRDLPVDPLKALWHLDLTAAFNSMSD